jgi:DNA ligase 1
VGSFFDFAEVCQSLSQTSSRLQIAALAADFLGRLAPAEAAIAARFMVGRALAQGGEPRLNVSGRAVWKIAAALGGGEDQGEDIFTAAADFGEAVEMVMRMRRDEPAPTLTLVEVGRAFEEIAEVEGRGARKRKLDALSVLFARMSPLEAKYAAKVLIGEMRHGMSEGLMLEALAKMAGRPVDAVRRMHMLEGDVGRLAQHLREPSNRAGGGGEAAGEAGGETRAGAADAPGAAATGAPAPAAAHSVAHARALRPMLAQPAREVADALAMLGPRIAVEHKLDGARVQIHHAPGGVRIFSRRLNEITQSLPEVAEAAARLGGRHAILDGEVIAVDGAGRPLAFQEVMRRFGRVREVERLRVEQPVRLFVFDLLALDGELWIDRPYEERYAALARLAAEAGLSLAQRIVPAALEEAERFYAAAIEAGYEGVMAKALASRYTPGARGRGWLKIKHAHTLDLAIVAADWGYGRRHGWLSNYHLAARDPEHGGFVEVGKTFKGLTDDQFEQMTARLLALKTDETRATVFVRPEVVVEVAYSDIQRSSQYAGGMALRFARIVRVRDDKPAAEADTLAAMAEAFDRQPVRPGVVRPGSGRRGSAGPQ